MYPVKVSQYRYCIRHTSFTRLLASDPFLSLRVRYAHFELLTRGRAMMAVLYDFILQVSEYTI